MYGGPITALIGPGQRTAHAVAASVEFRRSHSRRSCLNEELRSGGRAVRGCSDVAAGCHGQEGDHGRG